MKNLLSINTKMQIECEIPIDSYSVRAVKYKIFYNFLDSRKCTNSNDAINIRYQIFDYHYGKLYFVDCFSVYLGSIKESVKKFLFSFNPNYRALKMVKRMNNFFLLLENKNCERKIVCFDDQTYKCTECYEQKPDEKILTFSVYKSKIAILTENDVIVYILVHKEYSFKLNKTMHPNYEPISIANSVDTIIILEIVDYVYRLRFIKGTRESIYYLDIRSTYSDLQYYSEKLFLTSNNGEKKFLCSLDMSQIKF